jgi:hypothetical protein
MESYAVTLPSTLLRLALGVLLLVAPAAAAQVASCTQSACGLFIPTGSQPPSCRMQTSQFGCRASFGCSCESNCPLYGDCCNQWDAVCNVPLLSAVTPTRVSTAGGTVITLSGVRLGSSAGAVSVGGLNCPVNQWTNTSVLCLAPAGVGSSQPVVATTDGGRPSNSISLGRLEPIIIGFTPTTLSTSGEALTLAGSNFGALAATVVTDAGVAPVTMATHTQVVATAREGDDALSVLVRAADLSSNVVVVPRSPPAITTITPSTVNPAGGLITLSGANFGTAGAATVTVGGVACPLQPGGQPHTRLVCLAPSGSGSAVVAVSVRGRVGLGSVSYPGIGVTSVNPPAVPTIGGRLTFTGTGLNASGLSISVGGLPCPVVVGSVTATSIQCDLGPGVGQNLPVRVTVGPTTSGDQLVVSYLPPAILSIQPATGPTAGGVAITINGANFGPAPTVTVGGATCPVSPMPPPTNAQVVCTLPAGVGVNVETRVRAGGQEGASSVFSYDAPNVTGLSPVNPPTAGGLITLVGANFGAASAAVTVDGLVCPVMMATHTTLVCQSPAGPGGMSTVRLVAGGQLGQRAFTWASPTLLSVSPSSASTRGGVPLTLTGSNFGDGTLTTVSVGGRVCPALTTGHVSFTCALPEGATPGMVQVTANVAGATSQQVSFSYAGPSVTSVTPSRAPTAGGVTLTIRGDSFGTTSAAVTIAGQACPVLQQTHGVLLCRVGPGQGQNLPLVVSSGGLSSAPFAFGYEPPLVESTWPPKLPTGAATLWVRGRDFGVAPTVTLGGVVCPVLRSTASEIVCSAPAGMVGAAPLVVTTAGQSSATAQVLRVATCGRELSNGAACEDPRECRGAGVCFGNDCVGAPAASEGLACDDGDPCTTPGTCRSGTCVAPIGLDGGEACVTASTCSGLGACGSGRCSAVPVNEDGGCTDYDGTTAGDVCRMGLCIGTPVVVDAGAPDAGGFIDGGSGGGSAGGGSAGGGSVAGGSAAGGSAAGGSAAGGSAAGGSAAGGSAAGGSAAGGSAAGGSAAGGSAAGGSAAGGSAAGGSAAGGSAAGGSASGGSAGGGSAAGGSAAGGSAAGGSAAGGSAAGGSAAGGSAAGGSAAGGSAAGGSAGGGSAGGGSAGGGSAGGGSAGGGSAGGGSAAGGTAGGGSMNGQGCTCQTTDASALWMLALIALRRRRRATN